MCGRFALTSSVSDIQDEFGLEKKPKANIPPRYNIAPSQVALIVRQSEIKSRELAAVEWGLVPEWVKERRTGKPLINSRIETIKEKPSFRAAMKRTRCLVPANGWYEWSSVDGVKQPWFIEGASRDLFAFAGIWTTWHGPDGESWLETMAVITAPAVGPLGHIHHRKPLVVKPEGYSEWLEPHDPLPKGFLESMSWRSENTFIMHKVSTRVNSVYNDDIECLDPPREERQGSLF